MNIELSVKEETEDTYYRPADRRSFFTRQGSMLLGAYELAIMYEGRLPE